MTHLPINGKSSDFKKHQGACMKSRNDRVLEWAASKVARDFKDDVAILAVYGSYVNGTSDELSDVDFFFIPKTERGLELSKTFIIEGVGFDLFPMRWARVEKLADFLEPLAPLLGDSRIAFASSAEDEQRFLSLRGKMECNLKDARFMHGRASDSFRKGFLYLHELRAEQGTGPCRLLAGQMMLCLSDAVAYENQTYFRKGLKSHFDDLSVMKALPKGFLESYDGIIGAADEASLKDSAERMASCCRAFIGVDAEGLQGPEPSSPAVEAPSGSVAPMDYDELVSFYEEAVSTFNKVWRSCDGDSPNCRNAFISGVCLQRVLDEEVPQLGLEVLGSFDCRNLERFSSAVRQAEEAIVSCIEKVRPLVRYGSVEEFLTSSV